MADYPFDRETSVYIAELAQKAELYDDMVIEMNKVAKMVEKLTADEMNLVRVAYKNVIGPRMDSWRILSVIEQKEESRSNEMNVRRIKRKMEREISKICRDILPIIDKHLIPSSISTPDASVFYYKMKGDYYRYLAEIKTCDDTKDADKSLEAYEAATRKAEAELQPVDPVRLGLALNLSVFYNVILQNPERACEIAKLAIDEANSVLDSLYDKEACTHTLGILQDNITLWQSNMPHKN